MVYYILTFLAFLASTVAAQTTTGLLAPRPTPPLVEQAYGYYPNKVAAGIFTVLYGIATFAIFFRLFGHRTWWGLCLPIGAAVMTAGFAIRIVMHDYPNSLVFFLCSQLFILLSPTTFLAFNYMLYGRFVVGCVDRRHALIRPERTARYFIVSDVVTFLVQGNGGSFLSNSNPNMQKIGAYIIIGGLGLQTLSFGLYMFFVVHTYCSLGRNGSGVDPSKAPWGMVLRLLLFTSSLFMLRCVYRTIEFAQGLGRGYLLTHEAFFYVFDALPLLLGVTAYVIRWPSRYLVRSELEMNAIGLHV